MLIDLGVKNIHSNELREFIKTLELDLAESSKGKTQQFMNNTLKNMAIFSVHNFCYTRAIDLLKETDTRLFTVFKALHEILNGYIRSYFESILSIDSLLLQMKNQSREVEKEAIDHTSDILTRAETLLEENERIEQEFHRKRREWEDEKKDLQRQMKEQEKENRELLDKILKLSKERAADPSKVLTPTLNSQASVGNILTTTRNVGDKTIRTQGTKTGRATANDAAARSPRGLQKNASPSMGNIRKSVESVQLSTLKNSTPPPKLLTLSHLRTIFRDLFASKKAHDLKCMQNGLPLETLEQYLYTFLSTRFGLKNLVVEWIDAILSAVAHFSKDDHEIALFGKILQNEIDEEFRVVQSEVRRTLGELIKVQLREAYPKKSEKFLNDEYTKRVEGFILRSEADLILEAVLKSDDLPVVRNHLLAELVDGKVEYRILERLILDFFLSKHEKYLSRVKDIFNSLDRDDDGIINRADFCESIGFIDPMDELKLSREDLLRVADRNNTDVITFSKYIEVLSGVKVRNGKGEEISLIQFSKLLSS